MFGVEDKNEIIMHSPVEFSPEKQPDGSSSAEKAKKLITEAYAGIPKKFYWKHYRKDGSLFDAEVSLTCIELNGENYLLSIVRNITERKVAEKALKESEEKYRFLFENVQDIYYKADLNGNIIDISPSVEIYSQYSKEDLLGKDVTDLYKNREDQALFVSNLNKYGVVNDYEILLRSKYNEFKYASINARLVKDSENNQQFIVGALRDITERKHMEEELIKARDKPEQRIV